jgi:hypothetical protein
VHYTLKKMINLKKQNRVIQIRVTEDEKQSFLMAAAIAGVSQSAWIRERLRMACIKDIESTGNKVPLLKDIMV